MSTALKVILVAVLLTGAYVVIDAGLQLRRDVWDYTDKVRFTSDIQNAWFWGQAANRYEGALFDLYDDVAKGKQFQHRSELDYTPLRLAVAARWQKWTTDHSPGING